MSKTKYKNNLFRRPLSRHLLDRFCLKVPTGQLAKYIAFYDLFFFGKHRTFSLFPHVNIFCCALLCACYLLLPDLRSSPHGVSSSIHDNRL